MAPAATACIVSHTPTTGRLLVMEVFGYQMHCLFNTLDVQFSLSNFLASLVVVVSKYSTATQYKWISVKYVSINIK